MNTEWFTNELNEVSRVVIDNLTWESSILEVNVIKPNHAFVTPLPKSTFYCVCPDAFPRKRLEIEARMEGGKVGNPIWKEKRTSFEHP